MNTARISAKRRYVKNVCPLHGKQTILSLLLALLCVPACATIDVKAYGAQGDGRSNDTASFNHALRDACAASEDLYIPAGTYLIESLESLSDCGVTIRGGGPSNTILQLRGAPRQSMWTFDGGPAKTLALAIEDLALDGGQLGGSGISIDRYQTVTLTRVFVHDFGTPGYDLGHKKAFDGLYIRNVEDVRIAHSQFIGNERYGIELQAVHNSVVQNSAMSFNGAMGGVSEQNFEGPLDGPLVAQWLDNALLANGSGGIDVETDPSLAPVQGILRGNHIIDCGNKSWDSGWALVLGLHSFGSIEDNWIQNFAANAPAGDYTNAIVYGKNAAPISIVNNTIIGTRSHAILGNDGDFPVLIAGNTLTDNGTGIFIYNSPHVEITNNKVTGSIGVGIAIFWCTGCTVSGNQFSGNFRNLGINGRDAKQSFAQRGLQATIKDFIANASTSSGKR